LGFVLAAFLAWFGFGNIYFHQKGLARIHPVIFIWLCLLVFIFQIFSKKDTDW
jgi:hypothetical protein